MKLVRKDTMSKRKHGVSIAAVGKKPTNKRCKTEVTFSLETMVHELSTNQSFKKWRHRQRSTLQVLAMGKAGDGKSTLLNGITGKQFADFKEGPGLDRQTLEVEPREIKVDLSLIHI